MNNNIKIDTKYFKDFVPQIKAITSRFEDINSDTYNSTTRTPSNEPNVIITMLAASKSLFNKITSEIQMLEEISDNYEDLDLDLSNIASELNMQVESTPSEVILVKNNYDHQNFDIDKYNKTYENMSELYNITKPTEIKKKNDNYYQQQYTGYTDSSSNNYNNNENKNVNDNNELDNKNNQSNDYKNNIHNMTEETNSNNNDTSVDNRTEENKSSSNNIVKDETVNNNTSTNNVITNKSKTINDEANNNKPQNNNIQNNRISSNENSQTINNKSNNNNVLKTIGIVTAGVGATAGVAYGIHKKSKNNNELSDDGEKVGDE